MFKSWSLDSALLGALEEGNYVKEQVLLSAKFSPIAVSIDSSSPGKSCFFVFFKHLLARFVAFCTFDKRVSIILKSGGSLGDEDFVHCAKEGYATFLSGKSITLNTEFLSATSTAVLLIWRITRTKRMMDVYNALKRAEPDCNLTLREQSDLPSIFSFMCKTTYSPSPDLIKIEKSILS